MSNSIPVRNALAKLNEVALSLRGPELTPEDAIELYAALDAVRQNVMIADRNRKVLPSPVETRDHLFDNIAEEAKADRVAVNPYKLTSDLLKIAGALADLSTDVLRVTDGVLPPE